MSRLVEPDNPGTEIHIEFSESHSSQLSETSDSCSSKNVSGTSVTSQNSHTSDSSNYGFKQGSSVASTSQTETCTSEPGVDPSPVMNFDGRKFASLKYEQQFNWVYYSSVKGGYLCKICDLFAVEKDGQSEYIDKGVQLGEQPTRKLATACLTKSQYL